MKWLFLVFACASAGLCHAQKVIDVSQFDGNSGYGAFVSGGGSDPYSNVKYVRLTGGSPYFREGWTKGDLIAKSGTEYRNMLLRIDLFESKVHYLDRAHNEYVASTPLKRVVLHDSSGVTLTFVHSSELPQQGKKPEDHWYQLLAEGKTELYKIDKKFMMENKPYGSSTVEQSIKTSTSYVLRQGDVLTEFKKMKELPSLLSDKKSEVESFIKTQLDEKAPLDYQMIAVMDYYNSITAEKK